MNVLDSNSARMGGLVVAGIMLSVLTEALAGTILSLGRIDMIGYLHATLNEFAALDISYTAAKLSCFIMAGWLIGHVPPRRLVGGATLAEPYRVCWRPCHLRLRGHGSFF